MVSNVYVCSKLKSLKNNSMVKIDVDLNKKVSHLSELIAKQLDVAQDKFNLMCFGHILSDDNTIESYNIKNGTTVYVLQKAHDDSADFNESVHHTKPSQSEISQMVIALRTALMNPSFRNILDKLNDNDVRENLMAVTPGLREDQVTIAILQDADLLSVLTDPNNIQKVLEKHPCLSEAATNLAAAFHEENISGASNSTIRTNPTSYSLDALSDDDDMSDSSLPNDHTQNNAAAQEIANYLIRAFQRQNQPSQPSQGVITREMLMQALQSSQSSSTVTPQPSTSSGTANSGSTSSSSSSSSTTRNWTAQLQQMRDLGILDDAAAIQALEIANGDVQQAVNLIFSDFNN